MMNVALTNEYMFLQIVYDVHQTSLTLSWITKQHIEALDEGLLFMVGLTLLEIEKLEGGLVERDDWVKVDAEGDGAESILVDVNKEATERDGLGSVLEGI